MKSKARRPPAASRHPQVLQAVLAHHSTPASTSAAVWSRGTYLPARTSSAEPGACPPARRPRRGARGPRREAPRSASGRSSPGRPHQPPLPPAGLVAPEGVEAAGVAARAGGLHGRDRRRLDALHHERRAGRCGEVDGRRADDGLLEGDREAVADLRGDRVAAGARSRADRGADAVGAAQGRTAAPTTPPTSPASRRGRPRRRARRGARAAPAGSRPRAPSA